jgi:hypothetical protein
MYHEFLMPYVKLMSIVNKHLGTKVERWDTCIGKSKIILIRCGHGFSNNCPGICANHFLNVKISQIVLFFIFSHTLQ